MKISPGHLSHIKILQNIYTIQNPPGHLPPVQILPGYLRPTQSPPGDLCGGKCSRGDLYGGKCSRGNSMAVNVLGGIL